ncbi:hypothetical protein BDP27DRAFT_1368112 [Rhodocollybia butyracea]|uniref:Uncharacterized protein n=1 Tax=Rhodocollybia butyracea TaxID=206335 RepID=A0A9P5PDP2_9AGAR|nr:hypothetical protein BDP27DRAFT_1368112 [Rhodocollybia butyracea]
MRDRYNSSTTDSDYRDSSENEAAHDAFYHLTHGGKQDPQAYDYDPANRLSLDSYELLAPDFCAPLTLRRPTPVKSENLHAPLTKPTSVRSDSSQDRDLLKTPERLALEVRHLEARVWVLQRQVQTYKDLFDCLGYICSGVGDEQVMRVSRQERFYTVLTYI